MITKERLEELIEKQTDIWKIEDGKVYPLRKDHYEYWNIKEDRLEWYWKIVPSGFNYISFEYLFETKEDAEEYAEFGEVKKEIKFPFVDWQTLKHDFIDNPKASGTYVVFEFDNYSLDIVVCHTGDIDISVYEKDFYKPLTRENYNEARRLCKKLFLGENL